MRAEISWFSLIKFTGLVMLTTGLLSCSIVAQNDGQILMGRISEAAGVNHLPANVQINSLADCEGPEGKYQTVIESDGHEILFRQIFTYKPDSVSLRIKGLTGKDDSGADLSDFMIFYGRSHDFVRMALFPEYMLNTIDSVSISERHSTLFGKTTLGYRVEYQTGENFFPSLIKLFISGDRPPLIFYFEEWNTVKGNIRVPERVRITDEEKTFFFNYREIQIPDS